MRSVLVAFNEPKLLKAISKNVQKNGAEDIVFTVKTTKASFLSEVASGNYNSAIIMEQIGREPWTIPEMVQIADSYNINLIPIISENHKGTRDITALSSVGITSAVFIRKGGVYKADEILRMIEHPRTLKEARTYYGIETYADQKSGNISMASESKIADAIDCLNANRDSDALGDVLIQILVQYKFDLAQAAELLERLDNDMTLRLQKTVEYYDLLGDLKKHDLVANYRIPREIRKLKKSQGKTGAKTQEVVNEDTPSSDDKDSFAEEEPVVVMPGEIIEDIPEDKIRMADAPVLSDMDTDISYEEDEENFDPDEYDEEYGFDGEQNDMGLDEEDYTLSEPEPVAETSAMPDAEDMEWDDEFSFDEQLTVSSDMTHIVREEESNNEEKEPVKKSAGELKKERKNEMKSKLKEQRLEKEMEEEKSGPNFMLIGIMAALVLFMLILAVLFVKISIERANKKAIADYESGYNTKYSDDDVATYEINENGSPILKDENGNVIYDGSMPETAPADQEEMDIAIVTEEESNVVQQEFNDTSGFEEGVSYKGLDIVNLINGNQGADCTLQLKNGATVEVHRGNASIEDFKPSGTYQCQKTEDGGLIITEK